MITKNTFLIISYTLLFYSVSLTLGFFSSYVLSKKNYNFRFPLFITAIQNLIHFILSNCVIAVEMVYRKFRCKKMKSEIGKCEENIKMKNGVKMYQEERRKGVGEEKGLEEGRNMGVLGEFQKNMEKDDNVIVHGEAINEGINSGFEEKNESNEKFNASEMTEINYDKEKNGIDKIKIEKIFTDRDDNDKLTDIIENQQLRLEEINFNDLEKGVILNQKTKSIEGHYDEMEKNIDSSISADQNSIYKNHIIKDSDSLPLNYSVDVGNDKKNTITFHTKDYADQLSLSNEFSETHSENVSKSGVPQYLVTIMPCAVSAALDIGMSSLALRSVTLAFYTMIKSSSPVFVLFSGFLFGIEKPSFKLFLTIFIIGAGVFVTTIKTDKVQSTNDLSLSKPTMLLLFASFMGGFRWAFVQYLLEKRKLKKKSIIYTIRDLCFPIGILLFTFSLYFEGFNNVIESEFFQNENAIRRNVIFILLSGILSFTLLVTEFLLVSKTSVVYLSVSGIVKELMIVFVSVCRKEIKFDTINYCGLGISVFGMVLYNLGRMKYNRRKES